MNYDMVHSKAAHKYDFKAFYKWANKKKYELQILRHNIYYTNIIAMQDAILIAKILDGSVKKKACC